MIDPFYHDHTSKTPNELRLQDDLNEAQGQLARIEDARRHLEQELAVTKRKLEDARLESAAFRRRVSAVVRFVVQDNCSCGGGGPSDDQTCEWCLIWHALLAEEIVQL